MWLLLARADGCLGLMCEWSEVCRELQPHMWVLGQVWHSLTATEGGTGGLNRLWSPRLKLSKEKSLCVIL